MAVQLQFGERLGQPGGCGCFGAVVDAWQQLDVAVELFHARKKYTNCDMRRFLDYGGYVRLSKHKPDQ